MMEPVEFPDTAATAPMKSWAVRGNAESRGNLVTSIFLSPEELERHIRHLESKYQEADQSLSMFEPYRLEDAELVTVGYGITSRVLKSAVDQARMLGVKAGLFRPITLWPFPSREIEKLTERAEQFLVVELSTGQMVDDVRLAVQARKPVEFYGRFGGVVPTAEELLDQILKVKSGAKTTSEVHSVYASL
jgi:pyruvate/2-oxoacid:ferredoxin oxidoreductase alpha subunit